MRPVTVEFPFEVAINIGPAVNEHPQVILSIKLLSVGALIASLLYASTDEKMIPVDVVHATNHFG